MIIKRLIINNMRNYSGTNEFDLATTKDKNIILVGGQNGAGKTSLADAIRLCLYGHWVDGRVLSEKKYQEYLNGLCSTIDDAKSFFVKLDLVMDEESPPLEVSVTRMFVRKGDKFSEELILKKAESEVEFIDESYWSYYIEKLISPTVSRYFFFDGEKVRDTISSSESNGYLSQAVNDISGVTELNNLKNDLKQVRKQILARSKQKSSLNVIEDLNSKIQNLSSTLEELNSDVVIHNQNLKDYLDMKIELDEERERLIGASESKREELSGSIDVLKQNYDSSNQDVITFCHSRLMYRLADRLILDVVARAKAENASVISKYTIEQLQTLRDSSDSLISTGLEPEMVKLVIDGIIENMSGKCDDNLSALLDLTLSRIEQIDSMRVSNEDCSDFIESFHNRQHFFQEMEKLRKQLAKTSDESLDGIDEALMDCNVKAGVEKLEIEKLESRIKDINAELDSLNVQLRREERNTVLADVDQESIKTIDLALKGIEARIEISLLKSRQTLSKRINEMYSLLKNTKDMVKEIRLTDSFELELVNFQDKVLNNEFISEGEKGILMYSVMYGLHSLSAMRFPVIIDSPLGRMDSLHVNNLASKLFPSVSDQVILLSHDREVVGENHELIRPFVSKHYLITKFGKPKITEGYFE